MREQKLWLCGMFRGDRTMLEKTVLPVIDHFDGLICVVDSRLKPADLYWLEAIKRGGQVIVKDWVNDHAHTSNEVLLAGVMDWPDYFIWIDETDELNPNFVKDLRENIKYWHKNNIGQIYLDHPFVLRFHDGLRFQGNPHWGVSNIIGGTVALEQINGYSKEKYVKNNRDLLKSGFLSPAKYYIQYPNFSNHTQLLYSQFGPEVLNGHETLRIAFRNYLKEELGLDLTLDSFIKYLKDNVGNYPDQIERMLETEVNLADMFRLYVLEQPMQALIDNRFWWKYSTWKNQGLIDQPKTDENMGSFARYKKQAGLPIE